MINASETQALRDLQRIANDLEIPIMLIGAGARLLMLDWKYNLASSRTTKDWDLAVKVNSWDEFDRLRQALLQESAQLFQPTKLAQRLIHISGVPIDLVPFGGLARADGTIVWPDDNTEMTILGFDEALLHANLIELDVEGNLLVASIPALVVMKLFAFADRKHVDDLKDAEFILKHYLQYHNENRVFDELATQLASGEIEYQEAGPFLLGKDAGQLCNRQTIERLLPILDALVDPYAEKIGKLVGPIGDVDEEEKRRRQIAANFKSFQDGIKQIKEPKL